MKTLLFSLVAISSVLIYAAEKEIWYDYQGKPVMQTEKSAYSSETVQPRDIVSAQAVNLQKISPLPWTRSPRYRSYTTRDIYGFYPQYGWMSYDCYRRYPSARGNGFSGWYQSNGQWGINYQRPGFSLQWSH
jgi:hypothetical protein